MINTIKHWFIVSEISRRYTRVTLPRASETIEVDVVEVTPDVPPSVVNKRKRSEEVGGTDQCKKSRAPFSLLALKHANGLVFNSSRPSLLHVTAKPWSPPLASSATQAVATMTKYMKIQKKSLLQRLLNMPRNTMLKPYTTKMAKIQGLSEGKNLF